MPLLPCLLSLIATNGPSSVQDRAKDWRIGPVIYQVFVDRFAPSSNQAAKAKYYQAPRKLMPWSETPRPGHNDPAAGLWSHEMEFWGGDLNSVAGKLDYVHDLGADVLYLTPIHEAFSNHKYDATDYKKIDPGFGTRADFLGLVNKTHTKNMKIMLDGVFNHMGRHSAAFQDALKNPKSPYRDWFSFGPQYSRGYKGWVGIANLPALKLEDPGLRKFLWGNPDSVVKSYLKDGIDGWRLDVGYELGPEFLSELTQNAHKAKPGCEVVAEVLGYPAGWSPAVDGVFNFFAPGLCMEAMSGRLSGGRVGQMLTHLVDDAGIENLLRSWIQLDNHDTPRIANMLPDERQRRLAFAMLFTLPGSPVVYYGSELGMKGAGDPQNRAPMRWDLANSSNSNLSWVKKLIQVRKSHPALRYGDFTALDSDKLLAFARTTGKLRENVIVVMNPSNQPVRETFPIRIGNLMSWQDTVDLLTGIKVRQHGGMMNLEVPPMTVRLLVPVTQIRDGHSQTNRIK